jgi:hypothetical protein
MKAQKVCPNKSCGRTVHARVSQCSCGHIFYERKGKPQEKTKAASSGPGPGKKCCGGCNTYVGVRNRNCPNCNFDFASAKVKPEVQTPVKSAVPKLPEAKPVEKIRDSKVPDVPANRVFYYEGVFDRTGVNQGDVLVPAGKPAFDLKDFSPSGIKEWAVKVAKAYTHGRLTCGALEYFSRRFYKYPNDKETEQKITEALYGL